MIKNKSTFNTLKYRNIKHIFYILCILYIAGLFAGCTFTVRNSRNTAFVEKVTFTTNFIKTENPGDLSRYRLFLLRDIACIISVLLLKYSGIMKSLCVCVPFFRAVQNSSIATADFINKAGVLSIVSGYVLRNTATAFILLIFCTIAVKDIISEREDQGKDIKKAIIFCAGIAIVYLIDFTVKNMFS